MKSPLGLLLEGVTWYTRIFFKCWELREQRQRAHLSCLHAVALIEFDMSSTYYFHMGPGTWQISHKAVGKLLILKWWLTNSSSVPNCFNQEFGTFIFEDESSKQSFCFWATGKEKLPSTGLDWRERFHLPQPVASSSWELRWSLWGEVEHQLRIAALIWGECQWKVSSNILPGKHGFGYSVFTTVHSRVNWQQCCSFCHLSECRCGET